MDFVPNHTQDEIEDADFAVVANPSQTLILPINCSPGTAIRHFSNMIPMNDFGLPTFFVRSDLIDWTHISAYGHISHDALEAAAETLSYDEGYPTQNSGSPFWVQLKHEPFADYQLFQSYLELQESEGIRLLDSLSTQQQLPLEQLKEMANLYYWQSRSHAYDLFIVAATAKKRESRIRKTEDGHFTVAGGIIETILGRINDEPELITKMDAADLFDLFEKMVKVQRLSLGLTGQSASTNPGMPMTPGGTVEVILRQLTQNAGLSGKASDNIQDRLALLMGDEDTALMAQELVIRATTDNSVYDGAAAKRLKGPNSAA